MKNPIFDELLRKIKEVGSPEFNKRADDIIVFNLGKTPLDYYAMGYEGGLLMASAIVAKGTPHA